MTIETKQKLAEKNQRLISMVITRAKRDFPDDIALIGLTGSFSTNDYHEKSDLDLIIVNNTGRGWEISECFILDDVGYDIYCTPWDSLEKMAKLERTDTSILTDMQVLYYSTLKELERFNDLREKALAELAEGITIKSFERAKKHIDLAKQNYADVILAEDIGAIRYAASNIIFNVVDSIVALNNTCIKRGIKRYLEELATYSHLPENFEELCLAIVDAKTIEEIREFSGLLIKATISLRDKIFDQYIEKPVPSFENLEDWYEECWCNCRNKLIAAVGANNKFYTFVVANGAQSYFDEMTERLGTKKYDLMQHFDPDNLDKILDEFLLVMDDYLREYEKVGRKVDKYDNFDQLVRSGVFSNRAGV